MLSFFKRNNVEVPEWAQPLNAEQYTALIDGISKHFDKKGLRCTIEDGVIAVDEAEFGVQQMGLGNLLQVCYQYKKKDYPYVIKEHFDAMERAHKFDKVFKE